MVVRTAGWSASRPASNDIDPHFTPVCQTKLERYVPGYLVIPHRFWPAVCHLSDAQFYGQPSREIFESAYLDGASHWTAFRRLAIPLSVPAIASLAIFQFLWIWNDLLVALVFLGGEHPVMTYQIGNMVTSLGSGWHLLTAAAFISMALPMVIFFALQRYFVRGLLAGSVKG